MKKYRIAPICMAICLAFGSAMMPVNQLEVQAEEVVATVEGTVVSGTTSEILKLSTTGGTMEIKLDSGTDTSACKILLPDKKISVSLSYGSDGYFHAVKITSDAQTPMVTLDSSTNVTVTGTIDKKTTGDILYFDTEQGEMEIKLDATTNLSGCSVLVADKTYSITCVRGSDAYMHAVSISDSATATTNATSTANTATTASTLTPAPSATANTNVATASVSGTVDENTKENILYLSTDGGTMQFAIDSSTDASKGMVLAPGNKLTVSYYHGSDAYLHAVSIVGVKSSVTAAQIDTANTVTVSGTVGSKSTQNLLYLDTPQGQMELKLDAVSSVSGCKVLVSGKKLTVTCARGSDAYMHALTIVGK